MTIGENDSHPASGPDLRSLVAKVPLFEGLQDEALRAVEAKLEWLSLPGGWTLFSQGDAADALAVAVCHAHHRTRLAQMAKVAMASDR